MCHPLVDQAYLRLSSLKTIFEGFLSACWSQREAGRSQRQAEARAACILEGQDDQLIDELRRLDSYIKEGRVEVEKWKDFALQSARNMSSWMTLLRLHRYRAFWRLMLYKVVGTGPWTEANVYITYIYIYIYMYCPNGLLCWKRVCICVARYMCNSSIPIWYLLNIFIVARNIVCYSIRWQCHGDLQSQVDKKLYCKQCRWKRLSSLLPIGKSIYSPNQ